MSSNTTSTFRIDSSTFSKHIVGIEKMNGSNYSTSIAKSPLLLHNWLIHLQQHLKILSIGMWYANPQVTLLWYQRLATNIYQSHSLGPWVIDSSAIDHISCNWSLLHSFTKVVDLSFTIVANGSPTQACNICTIQSLSSLPVDFILYIPNCPFNLSFVTWLT